MDRPEPNQEQDERALGPTFNLDNIGWIDFETRSSEPLRISGAARYAVHAQAIMLPYAIGRGPVQLVAVPDFSRPLDWSDMPADFREHHARVIAGEGKWCMHNSAFDPEIWNQSTTNFPWLEVEHIIDTAVQATASGLPAALDGAAAKLKLEGKLKEGRELIGLFCGPGAFATPQSHPNEWAAFGRYACRDVGVMREIFRHTRQLPLAEWEEFWVSGRINARGVRFDVPLATAAARVAREDAVVVGRELSALTDGAVGAITRVQAIAAWLYERLDVDAQAMLVKRLEERDEDTGEILKSQKLSLTRQRVQLLLAYLKAKPALDAEEAAALRVLALREFGGSTTPAKFSRMLDMQIDGELFGMYVFAGAPQTGRYSSRGVQVHNLMRTAYDHEVEAINALLSGATHAEFAALGDDTPVSRKLSMLIRPTLIPREGKVFVWSDFSQIEARVLPWLDGSPAAQKRLDGFAAVDKNPGLPDLYTISAAELSHLDVALLHAQLQAKDGVAQNIRQRGKIAELALGFGGSVGALQSMGAGYGIHFSDAEGRTIVDRWREVNAWAPRFWGRHGDEGSFGLWGALNRAIEHPGQPQVAGRIAFVYRRDYLGGTAWLKLPSHRVLTYRDIRWERVEVIGDDDEPTGEWATELRFGRDYGRMKLWPGLICENAVQACAADCLRGVLRRLDHPALAWMPVVLHTHDEVVCEVDEDRAEEAEQTLREVMRQPFPWSSGLPLWSEESTARWYTKAKTSTGYLKE